MKILITGSNGFIGKNLSLHLKNLDHFELLEYDLGMGENLLEAYTSECDFVFHLAGINRPVDVSGFDDNYIFTHKLLQSLRKHGNIAPVLMSSSIQAESDNPYGISKRKAEQLLLKHRDETGAEVLVYRLPGVFGKWCKPNYNSVVATFCDSIANNRPVTVDDPNAEISLVYIDDVAEAFIEALHSKADRQGNFCVLNPIYKIKVGELKDIIVSFKESRTNLAVANMSDLFINKLYSTYVSYLAVDDFTYPLTVHADDRGLFVECLKSESGGQVAVNTSKPGTRKGGHWHHTKTEKILVVSGAGVIRFRKLGESKIIEVSMRGDCPKVVDVPPGYVHYVLNTGSTDMVMVIWANQIYDPQNPDTFQEVLRENE